MRALLREHGAEALIGLLVILLALWFAFYAWQRTGGGGRRLGAISVTAEFPSATGVSVGTDVRVAGLKVGQVSDMKLDDKTYQAVVTLALNPGTKLPADSSAAITSEGILGGNYISMIPGGDAQPLKNGDVILDTQGSVDLMSLVGQFINKSGGDTAKSGDAGGNGGGAGAGTPAAPTP